jgi:hypothetical protein
MQRLPAESDGYLTGPEIHFLCGARRFVTGVGFKVVTAMATNKTIFFV